MSFLHGILQSIRALGSEAMKEYYDKTPDGDFSYDRRTHFAQQIFEANLQRMRRFNGSSIDHFPAKNTGKPAKQPHFIKTAEELQYFSDKRHSCDCCGKSLNPLTVSPMCSTLCEECLRRLKTYVNLKDKLDVENFIRASNWISFSIRGNHFEEDNLVLKVLGD